MILYTQYWYSTTKAIWLDSTNAAVRHCNVGQKIAVRSKTSSNINQSVPWETIFYFFLGQFLVLTNPCSFCRNSTQNGYSTSLYYTLYYNHYQPATNSREFIMQSNLVIRNVLIRKKLVLRNHFQWPIANLLHKDKEHLALRNNFRVTKKFLITKFDCTTHLNKVITSKFKVWYYRVKPRHRCARTE